MSGKLRFVVQKHAAATLHYDLRLEMDGVLKSWAIPKEPNLEPAEKRLAVPTKDHPIEDETGEGHFELWDEGTWTPDEAPLRAYRRGQLKFELKGRRLKGHWALTRMGNAQTRKKGLWVLAKTSGDARR